MDSRLSWKNHINYINAKIRKTMGILNKLKLYFPICILRNIYDSLIMSHLNYGVLGWGYGNTDSLFQIQKKIVRIISQSNYYDHTDPIFMN